MVVGIHLDVFDESGKTRVQQINQILDTITYCENTTSISKDKKLRIIVTGDFNSLRKADYTDDEWSEIVTTDRKRNVETIEDVIPVLESNGFVDSFSACDKRLNVSVWSACRVDFVLGKNVQFTDSNVYQSVASDHHPVYADIEL